MTLMIDLKRRSGRIDSPWLALFSVEHIALPDTVPDGTSVAILTPQGETLAMALSQARSVALNTNTTQAATYAAGVEVGRTQNAFIAVGDTDHLMALVPVLVVANALDMIAPPTESAPVYPTTDELMAILSQVASQASQASQAAKDVSDTERRIMTLVREELPGVVEQIDEHIDTKMTGALSSIDEKTSDTLSAVEKKGNEICEEIDGKTEQANKASADATTAAAQTAADLEDVKAYHELMEANLGLVPAVAVDSAAVRDASRVLVGTDTEALTELMGEL